MASVSYQMITYNSMSNYYIQLAQQFTPRKHDYSVQNGLHTYHSGVPEHIQAGEHQFIECSLMNHWIDLILTAWYEYISVPSIQSLYILSTGSQQ